MDSRSASSSSGSGSSSSRCPSFYDELCSIRRSSTEHLALLDAMAEAHRAAVRAKKPSPRPLSLHGGQQQLLLHQVRPSSSGFPPLPPRGGFSSGHNPSSPWQQQQQLAWAPSSSATFGVPADLPAGGRSVSGNAPWNVQPPSSSSSGGRLDLLSSDGAYEYALPLSQLQQALPLSSSTMAGEPDTTENPLFAECRTIC